MHLPNGEKSLARIVVAIFSGPFRNYRVIAAVFHVQIALGNVFYIHETCFKLIVQGVVIFVVIWGVVKRDSQPLNVAFAGFDCFLELPHSPAKQIAGYDEIFLVALEHGNVELDR